MFPPWDRVLKRCLPTLHIYVTSEFELLDSKRYELL